MGIRHRNDVDATSVRRIDVVTTSCAYWEFAPPPLGLPKILNLAPPPPNILNLPTPMSKLTDLGSKLPSPAFWIGMMIHAWQICPPPPPRNILNLPTPMSKLTDLGSKLPSPALSIGMMIHAWQICHYTICWHVYSHTNQEPSIPQIKNATNVQSEPDWASCFNLSLKEMLLRQQTTMDNCLSYKLLYNLQLRWGALKCIKSV